ncbi:NADH dehydrogenase [ubiquinone] 1 beta subcomplex subunit 4 [Anthonomus grandis grandis]|uniref:NADH dehydrogenase [ubiquinone] 1 beta subcomplex subunit 4 n=1 Tax=Anthonomus grandis grandis TaxID=2921223 RepID=UPI0021655F8C|nr:NADH dehydrogenase [ubiquinone] 1 beta subcomplex subunit 4 [Anthonomus grandis grandis]
MADKQLDVSPEARQIAEEKTQRKLVLRNEFLKLKSDPFRHAIGEGGAVFDSKFLRLQSMQVHYYDYFKPKGKNVLSGILMMVVPMFAYGYFIKSQRDDLEAKYRRGEVAYKDRDSKWI